MHLKQKAFSGVIWTFFEMFGGQVINFFVNIVLARQLSPEDYGLLGMIFIFITISNVLMDSGISASILRSKEVSEREYATLFISNIFISLLIYLILFLSAPLIASFYHKEIISSLIRVFGLTIIIQAFVQVQSIYLQKNLNFKKQTLMKLPSILVSSLIAIYMAYSGYGVWSLIWMYLLQNLMWAVSHWVFGDWQPRFDFRYVFFKKHFGYGYRLTLVEILNNITANIYQVVIGKFYNPGLVGYYTQSLTLRQVPLSNVYGAVAKALLPVFSKIQDDKKATANNFYRCQEICVMVLYPIFIFMIYFSKDILVFLLSDKWRFASVYLQLLCLAGMFALLINWNLFILKIIADSKLILKYEFRLKLLMFLLIFGSIILTRNINGLLVVIPITPCISYLIYNYKTSALLGANWLKGISLVFQYIIIGGAPLLIIYCLNWLFTFNSEFTLLLVNGGLYFLIYSITIYLLKRSIVQSIFTFKN